MISSYPQKTCLCLDFEVFFPISILEGLKKDALSV
jgi:hypothetical protein